MKKYKYTKEQMKLLMDANYDSYKILKDSGLFENGVPPKSKNISWAMMAMLAGKKPTSTLDVEIQEYLKSKDIMYWNDL